MERNQIVLKYKEQIKSIVSGEVNFPDNKLLFIRVPERGLKSETIKITIEKINELVEYLWMMTFSFNIELKSWYGELEFIPVKNGKKLTFHNIDNNFKNKNFVVISLSELNFNKEYDYCLSPRWWTLKEPKSGLIVNLEEIFPYYNSEIIFGNIENKSFKELFEFTQKDYQEINKEFPKMNLDEVLNISYLVGKELSKRIKEESKKLSEDILEEDSDYKILLDFYYRHLNEEDLYFSTKLLPFNYQKCSYVLNKIQGQGEILFNIITLPEFIEEFPNMKSLWDLNINKAREYFNENWITKSK